MSTDPNLRHPELQASLDAAGVALDAAKATCTDACADEAIHEPHRAAVESSYAEFMRLSRLVTGPPSGVGVSITLTAERVDDVS